MCLSLGMIFESKGASWRHYSSVELFTNSIDVTPARFAKCFPQLNLFLNVIPFLGGGLAVKMIVHCLIFFSVASFLGTCVFSAKALMSGKKKPVAEGIFTTPATKDFCILRPRNQKIDPKNDGPWKMYLRLQAWRHFGALKLLDFRGVV